mmetsp:Transcript_30092/g.89459  ORF Transcript_30092/g.89459 Transcript_30092/m.89459 type:complete len:224 (-) Transcript_30092:4393-5064(-)
MYGTASAIVLEQRSKASAASTHWPFDSCNDFRVRSHRIRCRGPVSGWKKLAASKSDSSSASNVYPLTFSWTLDPTSELLLPFKRNSTRTPSITAWQVRHKVVRTGERWESTRLSSAGLVSSTSARALRSGQMEHSISSMRNTWPLTLYNAISLATTSGITVTNTIAISSTLPTSLKVSPNRDTMKSTAIDRTEREVLFIRVSSILAQCCRVSPTTSRNTAGPK